MNFVTMYREASPSTLATVALLTATLGFGGGWIAQRHAASRELQPYRGPVKPITRTITTPVTTPVTQSDAMCSALSTVEAECPGASRAINKVSPRYYRLDPKALKCLMSSKTTGALQAIPQYEPVTFHYKPAGFRVFGVKPCSLVARLGLQNGDIIRTVDSRPVNTEEDLVDANKRLGFGNYASVGFERKGEFSVLVYYLGPTQK